MLGYLDFLFLSYRGRIGRLSYWMGLFVLTLAQIGAIAFLLSLSKSSFAELANLVDSDGELNRQASDAVMMRVVWPVVIVTVLFLYPTYALFSKRWHDRNKTAWWSLIQFVPLIGGIWMFIELGFLGGDDGQNDYGMR